MKHLALPLLAIVLVSACAAQSEDQGVKNVPPSLSPELSIVSPIDGTIVTGDSITVQANASNIKLAKPTGTVVEGEGHFHAYLDGSNEQRGPGTSFTFLNVTPGQHTITVELHRGDHSQLNPPVGKIITVTVQAASSGAEAKTWDVDIRSYVFTPSIVRIKAGDSVKWTNYDTVGHSATADDGGWDTETGTGALKVIKFDKAGTYKYHCSPHPWMQGTIVVE